MKRFNKLLFVLVTLCAGLPAILLAQTVDTAWVRRYYGGGPGMSFDAIHAMAADNAGNVYVTGQSFGSSTGYDYATIKYYANGNTAWLKRYNGPGNGGDVASAIALDGSGNIYVTGSSVGSGTDYDYATIKYNSTGVQQWVQRYNRAGNGSDGAYSIAVDELGNVYVTGYSVGTTTAEDYTTIKYNSAGDTVWVRRYDGPGNNTDIAWAIAVDRQGNVYVTGTSRSGSTSYTADYATIKYNSSGDTIWVRRYNGLGNGNDVARCVAVDSLGNVYVTGSNCFYTYSYDYVTIKYNSAGDTMWVRSYNGPQGSDDEAYAIAVDNTGHVYVTGSSYNTTGNRGYATIKYNSQGDTVWVRRYNGLYCNARALAIDRQGNVYVTGGTAPTGLNQDCTTIKYDSVGVQKWIVFYNGPISYNDEASAMAVDSVGNVFIAGYSQSTDLTSDYLTIKYVQTQPGVEENHEPLSADRSSLEVYPNPAKTYFTVRLPFSADRSQIKIFDVTGNIAKSEELKGKNNRISLDGIKNGVYFIKVGDGMVKEKLVITK